MRLYNQYYRQRNPSRRGRMTPAKKELHADLSRMLDARRLNPEGGSSGKLARRMEREVEEAQARMLRPKTSITGPSAVEAFNALGKLNKLIGEGHTEMIPLRDTMKASIEGYLTPEQYKMALDEAVRDLTATEVKLLRKEFDKAYSVHRAVGFSRARADVLRKQVKQHPEVRAKRSKVQRMRSLVEREREAERSLTAKRKTRSYGDIRYTKEELAERERADLQADQELGRIRSFQPANVSLWEKVQKQLEDKLGGKYIKPRFKSLQMFENDLRGFVSDPQNYKPKTFQAVEYRNRVINKRKKESATAKLAKSSALAAKLAKSAAKRLKTMESNRFKSRAIRLYEKAGGEEYIGDKIRKSGFKNLNEPFMVKGNMYGVISEKDGKYIWNLIDSPQPPVKVIMKGRSNDVQSASRRIKIANRIAYELYRQYYERGKSGWDFLSEKDRRWLSDNKDEVKLSEGIARLMLDEAEKKAIDEPTMKWIGKAARVKAIKPVEIRRASPFKGMTTGEERTMKDPNNAYTVFVKKTMNGYRVTVQTKGGKEQSFFTERMSDIKTKSAVLGGLMAGSEEVAKAVSNPAKIRRLKNAADRYFKKNPMKGNRKRNPSGIKLERMKSSEADIKSLSSLFRIPPDPREAARLGLYFGIIRGLDTCGIQNYFERQRIRKKFGQKLVSGAFEATNKELGVGGSKSGGSRRSYRYAERYEDEGDSDDTEDYGTIEEMKAEF